MDSFILYNDECVEEEVSHLEAEMSKTDGIKLDLGRNIKRFNPFATWIFMGP